MRFRLDAPKAHTSSLSLHPPMSQYNQHRKANETKSLYEDRPRERDFLSRLLLRLLKFLHNLKLFRARKRSDVKKGAQKRAVKCEMKISPPSSPDSDPLVGHGSPVEQGGVDVPPLRGEAKREVVASLPSSDAGMHDASSEEHGAEFEEQGENSELRGADSPHLSSSLERALEALYISAAHAPISESLTVFFTERVQELRETESGSTEWAGLLADFADELQMMHASQTPQEQQVSDLFLSSIREDLSREGGELLDSDEWDPQIQRAVEVVHTGRDGEREQIDRKDSFGLRLRGKLLRKQNVKLTKS